MGIDRKIGGYNKKDFRSSIVWTIFASICFITGLVIFIIMLNGNNGSGDAKFDALTGGILGWLIWGGICTLPILGNLLRETLFHGAIGAEQGSHEYTSEAEYDGHVVVVRTRNHTVSGFFTGLIGGLIGGVLVGPIIIARSIIRQIIYIVKCSKVLKGKN